MQETFFNSSHLIKALNVYNKQSHNWSRAQHDLFWRQVIGYTQRFLPACLAQAFTQGLYYIVEYQQPLVRSLKLKCDDGSYYPLADSSGLGFDFFICAGVLGTSEAPYPARAWGAAFHGRFDKLCRKNTTELCRLEHRVRHAEEFFTDNDTLISRSRCVIS